MKRIILSALPLLTVLLMLLPGSAAQAKVVLPVKAKAAHTPATTDCTTQMCTASLFWPGNVYGTTWTVQVSEPKLRLNVSSDEWHRTWLLSDKSENDPASVEVGLDEDTPGGNDPKCGIHNGTNNVIVYYYDIVVDSNNKQNTPRCHPVAAGDINNYTDFVVTTDPNQFSTGCGILVRFATHSSGVIRDEYLCDPSTNFPPYDLEYGQFSTFETLSTVISTNEHAIWGTDMYNNQWQTGNYIWHPQTMPSEVNGSCSGNGCPRTSLTRIPFWYWAIYPANSPSGGDLYDCSYDPYLGYCVIGS